MHKTLTRLRAWFAPLPVGPSDPLLRMSQRELADLPPHHPGRNIAR